MKKTEISVVWVSAIALAIGTSVSALHALTPGLDAEEVYRESKRQQEIFERAGIRPGATSGSVATTGQAAAPSAPWSDLPGALGQEEISGYCPPSERGSLRCFHDERDAHKPGYAQVLANEVAASEAAQVDPSGLKAADCPEGLCSKEAVEALKNAKGENDLAVVMANAANSLYGINEWIRGEEAALGEGSLPMVKVPTTSFRTQVNSIQAQWSAAVASDEAKARIEASPVLKSIQSRYSREVGIFAARVHSETPGRHGLGR